MNRKELNKYREKIKDKLNDKLLQVTIACVEISDETFSEYINNKNKLIEEVKDFLEKSSNTEISAKDFIKNVGDLINRYYSLDNSMGNSIVNIIKKYSIQCKPICLAASKAEAEILLKCTHLFPNRKSFDMAINSSFLKANSKYDEMYNMLREEVLGNMKYLLNFFIDSLSEILESMDSKSFMIEEKELEELTKLGKGYTDVIIEPLEKRNIKPKKTFDYKSLNKLAIENGYTFDRQSGDHAQYVKDGKIVTIPQGRPIGKGLSMKIQKSIAFEE